MASKTKVRKEISLEQIMMEELGVTTSKRLYLNPIPNKLEHFELAVDKPISDEKIDKIYEKISKIYLKKGYPWINISYNPETGYEYIFENKDRKKLFVRIYDYKTKIVCLMVLFLPNWEPFVRV